MTKREKRVINAFINCIAHGEYTVDYAITLIEDKERFGWLSNMALDTFYEELDKLYPEEEKQEEPTEESESETV